MTLDDVDVDDHNDHDDHDDATRKTAKRRVAGGQYSKLLVSYITIVMPVPRIGVQALDHTCRVVSGLSPVF